MWVIKRAKNKAIKIFINVTIYGRFNKVWIIKHAKNKATKLLNELFNLQKQLTAEDFEVDLDSLITHTGLIVNIVDFKVAQEGLSNVMAQSDWEGVGGVVYKHEGHVYLYIDDTLVLSDKRYIVAKGIAYQQLGMRNKETWCMKLTSDLDTVREKALVTFALELLMPKSLFKHNYNCTTKEIAAKFGVLQEHVILKLDLEK